MNWKKSSFERQQLFGEVWATPVKTLATKYGLSDVGLRKICVALDVPHVSPYSDYFRTVTSPAANHPDRLIASSAALGFFAQRINARLSSARLQVT